MTRLLQFYPFKTNTVGTFRERFPVLESGMFTAQLVLGENTYVMQVFPNFFFEGVDVSILDTADEVIIGNIPFNRSGDTNYLIGDLKFNDFSLIYNCAEDRFELYEII